jgi:membrane-associated protease RseP (regulator of RpoE activity)
MSDAIPEKTQFVQSLYARINPFFKIYEVAQYQDSFYFYGTPLTSFSVIHRALWQAFAKQGYQLQLTSHLGEDILVVSPFKTEKSGFPTTNVLLAVLTVFTTMLAGATMFGADVIADPFSVVEGLPFTVAIMAVLGSHEMGHYLMAKKRGMQTSLPYFIPFPSIIGTMGAVIKHKGPIPDRKALFDVAVAGPLVGLAVSIVVTAIGLMLPPVEFSVDPGSMMVDIQLPVLFEIIRLAVGADAEMLHPVAFAGWVGMFITLLNLFPTGQLDGGHALRAMIGEKARHVSSAMPILLALIAVYVGFILEQNASVWIFWSLLLLIFAALGHPTPMDDTQKLGTGRMAVGILTFALGALCFTLVPFSIVTA